MRSAMWSRTLRNAWPRYTRPGESFYPLPWTVFGLGIASLPRGKRPGLMLPELEALVGSRRKHGSIADRRAPLALYNGRPRFADVRAATRRRVASRHSASSAKRR